MTQPTYAAITSRSYRAGLVHALSMDGSVRTINQSIERTVWRALGTRSESEPVSE